MSRRAEGFVFLVGFLLTVPAANWLIGHVGARCIPDGPCLIPVGPGLDAPSGVLIVGLAFVLRDLVQRRLGKAWAVGAILVGACISGLIAPPHWVLASAVAFLVSEFADFAVYTPLERRGLMKAVLASSLIGLAVDSALFLYLAFGTLDFLLAQILGKLWMVFLSLPLIHWWRQRDDHALEYWG